MDFDFFFSTVLIQWKNLTRENLENLMHFQQLFQCRVRFSFIMAKLSPTNSLQTTARAKLLQMNWFLILANLFHKNACFFHLESKWLNCGVDVRILDTTTWSVRTINCYYLESEHRSRTMEEKKSRWNEVQNVASVVLLKSNSRILSGIFENPGSRMEREKRKARRT